MRLMQRLAISGLLSVIPLNPAWMQNNAIPGQDETRNEEKDRRVEFSNRQSEQSAVGPPPVPVPGPYVINPPNPPLDDVTNQRREKIKEMMKHGWDNYVRYAWGKNELRPISKKGHSASIFGASNMGATIVDGLDTLYIMGLHDEFKQGRDWIAENLDFDIAGSLVPYGKSHATGRGLCNRLDKEAAAGGLIGSLSPYHATFHTQRAKQPEPRSGDKIYFREYRGRLLHVEESDRSGAAYEAYKNDEESFSDIFGALFKDTPKSTGRKLTTECQRHVSEVSPTRMQKTIDKPLFAPCNLFKFTCDGKTQQ
ncbi:Mannosyl-oligosaccharide 1,2-alpha-mannosidase IB [Dufourea novaeangliae]|uniref:alpha-1,2-Mannosidase n=1 Tax=Dufourea novaeangliae TaxID=178035 RepID=A0A154PDI7_DUFNO|nr:Mannosyl-oligosaccharide 1,2-alpha-mannosidase IB [Dufourea novaeangliae]